MSRNMIKANEDVFDALKIRCLDMPNIISQQELDEIRYVKGNSTEQSWLENLKLEKESTLCIWNSIRAIIGEFAGHYYLYIVGLPISNLPKGIDIIDLNSGMFIAIISELGLETLPTIDPLNVVNDILFEGGSTPGYSGHDMSKLLPCFDTIQCFSIDQTTFPHPQDSIENILSLVLSENIRLLQLPFSQDFLDAIEQLCIAQLQDVRYDCVLQSLISTDYRYAFLSTYQMFEMYYQITYIKEVESKLNTGDADNLQKVIDETLCWKPNERNSLIRIFNNAAKGSTTYLTFHMPKVTRDVTGTAIMKPEAIWSWIYDLRCNIVHLKKFQKRMNLSDGNWNTLLCGMYEALYGIYS